MLSIVPDLKQGVFNGMNAVAAPDSLFSDVCELVLLLLPAVALLCARQVLAGALHLHTCSSAEKCELLEAIVSDHAQQSRDLPRSSLPAAPRVLSCNSEPARCPSSGLHPLVGGLGDI